MSVEKLKFCTGWKALPVLIKVRAHLLGRYWQRKKYPLFILDPAKGGLFKTYQIQKELRLKKIVKFNGSYYFALSIPKFPSRPYDHMLAKGGLNIMAAGTPYKSQIDIAILATTSRCHYHCRHCYEHFNLASENSVPVERWKEVVRELQETGVNIITFSGGEPLLDFQSLIELIESGDKDLSEFHIHTAGCDLTLEKAERLRQAGLSAAGIGLDDVDPVRNDAGRGFPGAFDEAVRAVQRFQQAGIFTYINMCLTKELVRAGDLWKYVELAKDLRIGAVRLLEPKPYGGYFGQAADDLFSEDDRKAVTEFFEQVNSGKRFREFPLLSYEAYFEDPRRLGCLMGGHSQIYIDSRGNVEPCVFLPVSFGNIQNEGFSEIYKRMRKAIPYPLHGRCPSLQMAEIIGAKNNQGIALPIPFGEIERAWDKMYQNAGPGRAHKKRETETSPSPLD